MVGDTYPMPYAKLPIAFDLFASFGFRRVWWTIRATPWARQRNYHGEVLYQHQACYSGSDAGQKGEAGVKIRCSSVALYRFAWLFRLADSTQILCQQRMREAGVEPARVAPQDPKSCASASSATLA